MRGTQFASAYAKLDRAEDHLSELRELLLAYMSRPDVVTGSLAGGPATGNVRMQGIGHRVQVIIGDVVHNLRSALDHVTWQLVLANGGEPKSGPKGTQFPIRCDPPDSLSVDAKRGEVSGAALKKIKEAQPSTKRDPDDCSQHPLAVLNHVSNTDKHREAAVGHRVLQPVSIWSSTWDRTEPWVAPFKTVNPTVDSVEVVLAELPAVLGDGGAATRFVVELELPGDERGPLYGTLDRVTQYVRQLVDSLVATV